MNAHPQLDARALAHLLDITRRLALPVGIDALLTQVLQAAREIMRADRGTVFLYDADTDELWSKVALDAGEIRIPASQGIAGECARTRSILNIPDCYSDPRFNQEVDRQSGYRTRCLMSIPLIGVDDDLVGVMQVLNKHDGVFDKQDEAIASALAAQCAVALQRATLVEERLDKQRLESELAIARDIQQAVLPDQMPSVGRYSFAGWSRAADQTGGDIFDAFEIGDDKVMLLLGDATGHGIGPALSVTQVRAMVRIAVRTGADLDTMLSQINEQLTEDLAGNRFVTAFIGVLDARTHEVAYHSAGQTPLLLLHPDGTSEIRGASAVPLGVLPGIDIEPPEPFRLQPGDLLALISDGIYESANDRDVEFGEQRTIEQLHALRQLDLSRQVEKLVESVDRHRGSGLQDDDMTILLIRRDG